MLIQRKGRAAVVLDDEQAYFLDAFSVVYYGCARSALVRKAIQNYIEAVLKELEKQPDVKQKVLALMQSFRDRHAGIPSVAQARRKKQGQTGDAVEEAAKELAIARNKVVDLFPGGRRRPPHKS